MKEKKNLQKIGGRRRKKNDRAKGITAKGNVTVQPSVDLMDVE
jgi:hypothetical protein